MNTTVAEGLELTSALIEQKAESSVQVLLAPPFTHLQSIGEAIKADSSYALAAQDAYPVAAGAYTGEVSVNMLKDLGVSHVIVGHSERRKLFLEQSELVARKIKAVLEAALTPILCVGEPLSAREAGKHEEYIAELLNAELYDINASEIKRMIIAYEPIWAIGTGKTATADQAQATHAFIRKQLEQKYDAQTAAAIPILYGGSCKPHNAASLFAEPDVDGGLIGGASLKAADFTAIIKHLEESAQ